MELKFDNEIYTCEVLEIGEDIDYREKSVSVKDPILRKFAIDMLDNLNEDIEFFKNDQDMVDNIEDVGYIIKGTVCLVVYDSKGNFIGKIHTLKKDWDFRLNIMYIYAAGRRRRENEKKGNKNFVKSSVIIWMFAALYANILYGKLARVLIPLPRVIVLKRLLSLGCTPVNIVTKELNMIDADISVKNSGEYSEKITNDIIKEDYIDDIKYGSYGMLFAPSELLKNK